MFTYRMHLFVAGVLFAGAACAHTEAPEPPLPAGDPLPGTEWLLTQLQGRQRLPGTQITLHIEADQFGGYDGCNWYGGRYTQRGDTLALADISATARACLEPDGVMQQEQTFLRLLSEAATFHARADTLHILGAAADTLLTFRRRPATAMDPAALAGTRWRLHTLNRHAPRTQAPITLAFSDTTVSGFAGCRDYTGTYDGVGDRIWFPSHGMLQTACEDEALLQQEGRFSTALSEAAHFYLGPDRLELYTPGGDTAVFLPYPAR